MKVEMTETEFQDYYPFRLRCHFYRIYLMNTMPDTGFSRNFETRSIPTGRPQ